MKTVHLVKKFTNYSALMFCGQIAIDFRGWYIKRTDLDANADTLYTDTSAKVTCADCLAKSNES